MHRIIYARRQTYGPISIEAIWAFRYIGSMLKHCSGKVAFLAVIGLSAATLLIELGEMLDTIQRDFGIKERKVVATVTDNASNFVKAFKEFGIRDAEVSHSN